MNKKFTNTFVRILVKKWLKSRASECCSGRRVWLRCY